MVRAALLTSAQLSSYDHSKHLLKRHQIMEEGVADRPGRAGRSSLVSGLCATTAAAPADVIKSRVMDARKATEAGQVALYRNVWDCVAKVPGRAAAPAVLV
jgi:hypothetical protein